MIIKETVANGATVEEAIEKGCRELGIEREDADFDIIELPKSKTLGLFGGSPAVVKVYQEVEDEEELEDEDEDDDSNDYESEEDGEKEEKPRKAKSTSGDMSRAELAKDYLMSIIEAMGLTGVEIEIVMNEEGDGAVLDLSGDALGAVIGRRGETLAALQYLVSLAANNGDGDYFRIAINIGNYREKREGSLENLAKKTALRSLKINRNLALDPMNPYERRIVHTAVQQVEGVSSWSVGEGTKRHVVIGPVGVAEGEDGLPVNHGRSGGPRGSRSGGYGSRGGYNKGGSYGNRTGGYNKGGSYGNRGGYNKSSYGGYNKSSSYNRDDNKDGYERKSYNRDGGGYNKSGSYNRDGGGYNKGGSYNRDGGGYNKSGSYNKGGYSKSTSAQSVSRETKKDISAPLYGKIEVPKKNNDNSEE